MNTDNGIVNNNISQDQYDRLGKLRNQSEKIFKQEIDEQFTTTFSGRIDINHHFLNSVKTRFLKQIISETNTIKQQCLRDINTYAQTHYGNSTTENAYEDLQKNITTVKERYIRLKDRIIEDYKQQMIEDIENIVSKIDDSCDEVGCQQIEEFGTIYNMNTQAYSEHKERLEQERQEQMRRQREQARQRAIQEAEERHQAELQRINDMYSE